jgi:pimeloyl-ACP methyl ester carboxylesterase
MKRVLIVLAILLIIALLVTIPKYLRDMKLAQKKVNFLKGAVINTTIAPIEYYRTGKGAPILISHGITGGFDQGLGLAKQYIGGEYDLISVSRFGYLGSPLPEDSSPDAQADAYMHLLDTLNIEKTFIFGNSAGGTSAIKFALKYPERCSGLILVSSNVPVEVTMPPKPVMQAVFGSNYIYWLTVKIMGENMLPAAGVTKEMLKDMSKAEKEVLIKDVIMSGFPISSRTSGVINDMYISNPDINNNYSFDQIKVPVLMIHAKDDPLCSYQGAQMMSKRISNNEFVSFENGGHIIIGHENEIQKSIASFISSISKK